MTEEEFDEIYAALDSFSAEFKALVRKYVPLNDDTDKSAQLLMMMQDRTSVYSPYVWSELLSTPVDSNNFVQIGKADYEELQRKAALWDRVVEIARGEP